MFIFYCTLTTFVVNKRIHRYIGIYVCGQLPGNSSPIVIKLRQSYSWPQRTRWLNFGRSRSKVKVGGEVCALLECSRFLILIFFSLFFVSGPCSRLSWPSRQLLSARKSTVSHRIVSFTKNEFLNTVVSSDKVMASRYTTRHWSKVTK